MAKHSRVRFRDATDPIYKESSIVVGGLLGTTSTPSSPEDEPSESEKAEPEGEPEKDES